MTSEIEPKKKRRSGYVIHIDSFEPDLEKYPIPPTEVERRVDKCVHTPQPEGYLEWHEWARLASKTHSQIRCKCCGRWGIWLPKKRAQQIRRQDAKEAREFSKAYQKHFELEKKERQQRDGTAYPKRPIR
jgi:hypothetical protein